MLRSSLCSLRCKAHQLLDTRALASAMLAATTRAPGPVRGGGLAPSSTNSTRPFCSYSSGGSSVLAGSRLRSGVMRALLPMQQQQRRQLLLPPAAAAAAAAGAGAGAQGPQQRARVSTAATASGGGSSSRKGAGSNSSSSGGTARPSAPLLLAVPGIGRAYVDRLAAQGISSIDKLAEAILTQLSRADAAEAFTPAVKHLQVRVCEWAEPRR
jgi:predicted flap endonuclease-1-like 5' DNA nuclease